MATKRRSRKNPDPSVPTADLPLLPTSDEDKNESVSTEPSSSHPAERVSEASPSGYRIAGLARAKKNASRSGATETGKASDDSLIAGFGPNPLDPYHEREALATGSGGRPSERVYGESADELRDAVQSLCPPVPGVYGMFDRGGELIYVGKSRRLRNRLLSYFGETASRQKAGRIIGSARAIQWETQPSDFAAQLRELELIRRWTPRFNVQGVPDRQRPVYLCLGRKPAETFYLANSPPKRKDSVAVEGPFYGFGRMGRVVDALNKTFRLRDCSQQTVFQFSDQLSLFDVAPRPGCLRLEIGTCLGPCASACSREEYLARVNEAESFLDGFNSEPLTATQEIMENAAENRQYELAGRARDTLKSLQYAQRKLGHLAEARENYSFIYAATGYDGRAIWYLIRRGEIIDVLAAPADAADYRRIKPRIAEWTSRLEARHNRILSDYPHTVPVVASWFRKHRSELKQTFAPASAGRKYRHLSRVS